MSEKQTVPATLSVAIYVDCPNEDCGNYINLLDERDTDGTLHDDDYRIMSREVFECTKPFGASISDTGE